MKDADRFRLLCTYRTPRVKLGTVLTCEARDCDVIVTGYTDARIPWPVGRRKGTSARGPVVYGGLVEAVGRESNLAVADWFGVYIATVSHWRRALGVEQQTSGTTRLRKAHGAEPWFAEVRKKGQAKTGDPEVRRKIGEALRGRKRPPHVVEAVRKAKLGSKHTEEAKTKMRAAYKANRVWSVQEDEAAKTLPAGEAARLTGRSLTAVYNRRIVLGLKDGRQRWSVEEDEAVRTLPASEAVRRTGRSLRAVYARRHVLHSLDSEAGKSRQAFPSPNAEASRKRLLEKPISGRTWTVEEDEMVLTLLPAEVVKRTGRTLASIYSRRDRLNGKRG